MNARKLTSSLLIFTAFTTTAFATTASAATYCVASAPNCSGTAEPDLPTALTKADGDTQGSDTIVLPATTMSEVGGFSYSGHVALDIVGQGPTASILTMPESASSSVVFDVSNSAYGNVTLDALGIEIPPGSVGDDGVAIEPMSNLDDVSVTAPNAISVGDGVGLDNGGSVESSTISVPTSGNSSNDIALYIGGSSTLQDLTLSGVIGLSAENTTSVVAHRLVAVGATDQGYAVSIGLGDAEIDDSVLEAYQGATALANNGADQITARQLTIVGDAASTGILDNDFGAEPTVVQLSDSIVADPLAHVFELSKVGSGIPSIATDHDDYDHANLPVGFSPGPGDLSTYAAPVFANPSNGDFRLLASSPSALFAADPTIKEAGESATDLDGMPRFNGALRDLGAYQHQLPTVTASAGASSATTGAAANFTATGTTTAPNDPLTYKWSFDDGQTATGASVSHAFAAVGSHVATVTVTDALGFTATATASVTVTAAAAPAPTQRPSNAFTLKSSAAKKTGVLTLSIHTKAPGTARIATTYSETVKTTSGKGKHRKTKLVHRTVTYARATTAKLGSSDATTLKLKPTAAATRHLKAVKHETVTVTVSFTPAGGSAAKHKLTANV
jgi:PKD domain